MTKVKLILGIFVVIILTVIGTGIILNKQDKTQNTVNNVKSEGSTNLEPETIPKPEPETMRAR